MSCWLHVVLSCLQVSAVIFCGLGLRPRKHGVSILQACFFMGPYTAVRSTKVARIKGHLVYMHVYMDRLDGMMNGRTDGWMSVGMYCTHVFTHVYMYVRKNADYVVLCYVVLLNVMLCYEL